MTNDSDKFNAAFARMIEESPALREVVAGAMEAMTPSRLRFPGGLRYLYYPARKVGRSRQWWCCWSTTKNANGKFVSWVYEWKGKGGRHGEITRIREHRRRTAAKARAAKLCESRAALVHRREESAK